MHCFTFSLPKEPHLTALTGALVSDNLNESVIVTQECWRSGFFFVLITWTEWLTCSSAARPGSILFIAHLHMKLNRFWWVTVGGQKNLMPRSLFALWVIHWGCKMPPWVDKRPNDKQNDLFLRETLLNVLFFHLSVSLFPFSISFSMWWWAVSVEALMRKSLDRDERRKRQLRSQRKDSLFLFLVRSVFLHCH